MELVKRYRGNVFMIRFANGVTGRTGDAGGSSLRIGSGEFDPRRTRRSANSDGVQGAGHASCGLLNICSARDWRRRLRPYNLSRDVTGGVRIVPLCIGPAGDENHRDGQADPTNEEQLGDSWHEFLSQTEVSLTRLNVYTGVQVSETSLPNLPPNSRKEVTVPISGLVVTFNSPVEQHAVAIESLRDFSEIEIGQAGGSKLAIVVDSENKQRDQEIWFAVRDLPGVIDLAVAMVAFDNDNIASEKKAFRNHR